MSKKFLHLVTLSYLFCWTSGCALSAWEAVSKSNDVDELRRFIRENASDPMVDEARIRIAEIEYSRAVAAHTRFAYRSFIERHPTSSQALDARRKLEQLEFEQISQSPSITNLEAYLQRHPSGHYRKQALSLLDGLLCQRLLAQKDWHAVAKIRHKYRTLSCSEAIQKKIVTQRYAHLQSQPDPSRLLTFLERFPNTQESEEVEQQLVIQQVRSLMQAARFDRAMQVAKSSARAALYPRLRREIEKARQNWSAALKLAKRTRFSSIAIQLEKIVELWNEDLEQNRDPHTRWNYVSNLAYRIDESSAEFLLERMDDPYLEVKRRSLASLRRLIPALGPQRGQVWLYQKLNQLQDKAKSGTLLFRLAVVNLLAGKNDKGFSVLLKYLSASNPLDLFAAWLGIEHYQRQKKTLPAVELAKRFTSEAIRFSTQRMDAYTDKTVPQSNRILRQLYGLIKIWQSVVQGFGTQGEMPSPSTTHPDWLQRSIEKLQALQRWFRQYEDRYARYHKGYVACHAEPRLVVPRVRSRSLMEMGFVEQVHFTPLIAWMACCYPDDRLRLLAKSVLVLRALKNRVVTWAAF